MSDLSKPYHYTPSKVGSLPAPTPKCNPEEAPEGYYAVPKPAFNCRTGNVCNKCDWRPLCQNVKTDFVKYGHRCMPNAVTSAVDGKTYQRDDKCSVIFKKKVKIDA
jgi:hypothetical protein